MLKEELIKKANAILNETKNKQEKYHEERIVIFKLIENLDTEFNKELLENILMIYDKNKTIDEENIRLKIVDVLKKNIQVQEIRKDDEKSSSRITLFRIKDKNNNCYTFFTRENAKRYIKENEEQFECDTVIQIIENENIDLEKIINNI